MRKPVSQKQQQKRPDVAPGERKPEGPAGEEEEEEGKEKPSGDQQEEKVETSQDGCLEESN